MTADRLTLGRLCREYGDARAREALLSRSDPVAFESASAVARRAFGEFLDAIYAPSEPAVRACAGCGARLVNLDAEWTPPGGQRWADDNQYDGPHNTATDCDRCESGVHEPAVAAVR